MNWKNKKLAVAGTIAALTIGGLSASSIASAQGYGGAEDPAEQSTEVPAQDPALDSVENDLVPVQDDETENPDAPQRHRHHRGGCDLEEAAAAIGIDEADLREALEGGQSIAEVAEANGVAVEDVIDAMVAEKTEHLEEKVAEGDLTQEEADEKLSELESRITDRVNGVDHRDEAADN